MGGHPYWYFVPYQENIKAALDNLRDREFKAGRYNPVIHIMDFSDPEFFKTAPGAKHKSIKEALKASKEDGTRSILDIDHISKKLEHFGAAPLPGNILMQYYETEKPTREMIEKVWNWFEMLDRGKCYYTIAYKDGVPNEIFFAGLSFD
jgi:hypothetical protein